MILRKTIKLMKAIGFSLSLLTLIHCGTAGNSLGGSSTLGSNDNTSNLIAREFGDAPDHQDSGYPSGIEALFPTLKASDGANHLDNTKVALGLINEEGDWPATTENDAIDPADSDGEPNLTQNPDQADQDHRDDGLLTLNFGSDEEATLAFSVTAADDSPQGTYYLNVLFDWNKNGEWKGADTNGAPEWAVQNMPVDINPGEEKILKTPVFMTGVEAHPVWLRLTLSDTPVAAPLPEGWTGTGTFDLGETEDYYLDSTQVLPLLDKDGVALPGVPLNKRGPQPLPGGGGGGGGGACEYNYALRLKVCEGKSLNRLVTIGGFAPDSLSASSNNPGVASVSLNEANVTITGNTEGTTTVNVVATQGGCTYYLSITVEVTKCPPQKKIRIDCCTQEEIRRDPSQCKNCHVVGRQHNATNTYGGGGTIPETDMEGVKTNISKSFVVVRDGGLVDVITIYYDCDPCPEVKAEIDTDEDTSFFESFFDVFTQVEFGGENQLIDSWNEYETMADYYDEGVDEALYECAAGYFMELYGENQ